MGIASRKRLTPLYLVKDSVASVRATVTVGVKVTSVPMIQGRHAKAPNVVTEVAREFVSPSAY